MHTLLQSYWWTLQPWIFCRLRCRSSEASAVWSWCRSVSMRSVWKGSSGNAVMDMWFIGWVLFFFIFFIVLIPFLLVTCQRYGRLESDVFLGRCEMYVALHMNVDFIYPIYLIFDLFILRIIIFTHLLHIFYASFILLSESHKLHVRWQSVRWLCCEVPGEDG